MKLLKFTLSLLLFIIFLGYSAHGNTQSQGLKKIVAIGYVDTGYMGFQDLQPEQLSEMFRLFLKKELEKRGYAPVLAQLGKPGEPQEIKIPEIPPELANPKKQPSQKDIQKMIAQAQQMMAELQGFRRPKHEPVAAQALFNFSVRTGESSLDTSEAVGWAEFFTMQPLGFADVSTSTTKIHLLVTQNDPDSGQLIDKKAIKASSTRFNRLLGVNYYSVYNSANHQAAFNRLFSESIKKAAEWIDQKMKNQVWEGEIFKKEGRQIYLNAGSQAGITPGMRFKVFQQKPVSGRGVDFGAEEITTGELVVNSIQEKFSVGTLLSGKAEIGSKVKPVVP